MSYNRTLKAAQQARINNSSVEAEMMNLIEDERQQEANRRNYVSFQQETYYPGSNYDFSDEIQMKREADRQENQVITGFFNTLTIAGLIWLVYMFFQH